MQPLTSHQGRWPKFLATKLRLRLAAAITIVLLVAFFSAGVQGESSATVETSPTTCPNQLLQNDGFELSGYPSSTAPLNWNTSLWNPSAQLVYDNTTRHSGISSARITAATANDAWFWQEVAVEANAFYVLTGWIKTENVSEGVGANLSLVGTWTHTQGLLGSNNWTRVSLGFNSGPSTRIGGGAGLTSPMGVGQTYATIIIEATGYGHRNVFKPEWGHSILFYFDAAGTAPKPTVTNHANLNQYVHWPTGDNYVWVDETDGNLIPNSIYNNESGFTHDYYSGTTATADESTRRLGITPEAWMLGGPVTKPGAPSGPPPVIACNGNIVVAKDPWSSCSTVLVHTRPTVSDACESNLTPVGTRSDGLPVDGPYPCGQTVITWTATNSENLTSSCQQVVTVTDVEPPAFIKIPPPVSVTTGPGATSCGAVVEDSQLVSTAAGSNPVTLDPIGDLPSKVG